MREHAQTCPHTRDPIPACTSTLTFTPPPHSLQSTALLPHLLPLPHCCCCFLMSSILFMHSQARRFFLSPTISTAQASATASREPWAGYSPACSGPPLNLACSLLSGSKYYIYIACFCPSAYIYTHWLSTAFLGPLQASGI